MYKVARHQLFLTSMLSCPVQVADGNGVQLEAGPGGHDRQGQDYPMPAELAWKDVSYRVKVGNPPKPKTVLHKSSGSFKPCEAIALMGPSGAGELLVHESSLCYWSTLQTFAHPQKPAKGLAYPSGPPPTSEEVANSMHRLGQLDGQTQIL